MSKIDINNTNGINPLQQAGKSKVDHADKAKTAAPRSKPEVSKDQLQFSNTAADVDKFVAQIKELPEIRADKVETIKNQINSGEFNPSNSEIADGILDELR